MKTTLVLAATAALASAQVTYDPATNKYKCAKPNVAYCAGDSLGTDIIIRCDANGNGQPGRCSDNLAGQPPQGVLPALCYQTDPLKGDAACEKNCVVYAQPSFTLPTSVCTPTYTASSSGYPTTSYPTTSYPTTVPTTTSTGYPTTLPTSYPTTTPTSYPTTAPTYSQSSPPPSYTSTDLPCTTLTTITPTTPPPTGYPTYSPPPHGNGTYTHSEAPTNTPVNPTKPTYTPPTVTAGAAVNQMGAGALAAVGLAAVFFL